MIAALITVDTAESEIACIMDTAMIRLQERIDSLHPYADFPSFFCTTGSLLHFKCPVLVFIAPFCRVGEWILCTDEEVTYFTSATSFQQHYTGITNLQTLTNRLTQTWCLCHV